MKYCTKCGNEIMDEAVICPGCGCRVGTAPVQSNSDDILGLISKIFLIISCVTSGIFILPLAWCLPITITICNKMKRGEPVGVGLKIAALLLVNTIAGILLLVRQDEQ